MLMLRLRLLREDEAWEDEAMERQEFEFEFEWWELMVSRCLGG